MAMRFRAMVALGFVLAKADCGLACRCADGAETFIPAEGGQLHLPGNARGIVWWEGPGAEKPPKSDFRVQQVPTTGALVETDFRIEALGDDLFLVAPVRLVRGARYRFAVTRPPGHAVEVTFDREPWTPREGGFVLRRRRSPFRGQLSVATARGSCSISITAAQQFVEAVFPEDVRPWLDGLLITTTVDGRPWHPSDHLCNLVAPGRSWVGLGSERLFTVCDPAEADVGLAKGSHTVRTTLRLPGTGVMLESDPAEIDLDCATAK